VSQETPAVDYRIDPAASRLTVRAFAGGMLSGMGHNPTLLARELAGEVAFNPEGPRSALVRLRVGAASLALIDSVSDKDRREIERLTSQEVLESAAYPEILFEASRIALTGGPGGPVQATLDGVLTLHGVSRPQQVAVRVYPNGDTLRAQGDATLRLTDFRIEPVSVAGGMLKVKDEVKLTFDIVARSVSSPREGTERRSDDDGAQDSVEAAGASSP
jgi:polyisoprenoid-binding protein YceI